MSIKAVRPHVMLNACLALSWLDKSFRPQSRVAQFRLASVSESAQTGDSKDVRRANSGFESRSSWQIGRISEGAALIGPAKLVPELYQR